VTQQRQSHLNNTLQPQIDDLEARLRGSVEQISDPDHERSVRRQAHSLVYLTAEDSNYEAMCDRMEMLGRQYRIVQARVSAARQ
jgi:hypothetical protein